MNSRRNEYDDLPMTFCSSCLWHGKVEIVIKNGRRIEYCPYCGGTHFVSRPAREWDELFQARYCRPSYYLCKEKDWSEIISRYVSKEEVSMMRYKLRRNFKKI